MKVKNDYYSYHEIVASLPQKKNSRSSIWVKLFIRKLSFPFTYIFVNMNITPWQASILSVFIALFGGVAMSVNCQAARVIGIVLLEFWLVLDCVDGNIARVTKTCSEMGEFVDTLSGYVISAISMISISIAAQNTTDIELFVSNPILIVIGAMGSICHVLSRLVHQNYMVTLLRLKQDSVNVTTPDDEVRKNSGLSYIRSRIDKEIGVSGLFMPLLIIGGLINRLDIFTILYSLFFITSAVLTCGYYAFKAKCVG